MATGSIFLSAAIRTNLLSLQQTSDLIGRTQGRLSTGLEVQTALDDPVKFFTSKSLADRATDINEKKTGVDQSVSTLHVAINATQSIDQILKQMKGLLITAKSATITEKNALQAQFNSLAVQLNNFIGDATYNGVNLVNSTATIMTVQFSSLSTSKLDITGVELKITALLAITYGASASLAASGIVFVSGAATDISDGVNFSDSTASNFDAAIVKVDATIDKVRGAAKTLGSNVSVLQARLDFSNLLTNTLTLGADKLRLADLNQEGANLVALQTRQQLGYQALAFAGQAEQSILTLFR